MNWKKKVAKEWLWFICTVAGVLLSWSIFSLIMDISVKDYWEGLLKTHKRGYTEPQIATVVPIAFVYFIRLTIWAMRQVKAKEK